MAPKDENSESRFSRKDVYTRVTDRIIADLEKGVRTWMKPWSGDHAAKVPCTRSFGLLTRLPQLLTIVCASKTAVSRAIKIAFACRDSG